MFRTELHIQVAKVSLDTSKDNCSTKNRTISSHNISLNSHVTKVCLLCTNVRDHMLSQGHGFLYHNWT